MRAGFDEVECGIESVASHGLQAAGQEKAEQLAKERADAHAGVEIALATDLLRTRLIVAMDWMVQSKLHKRAQEIGPAAAISPRISVTKPFVETDIVQFCYRRATRVDLRSYGED